MIKLIALNSFVIDAKKRIMTKREEVWPSSRGLLSEKRLSLLAKIARTHVEPRSRNKYLLRCEPSEFYGDVNHQ